MLLLAGGIVERGRRVDLVLVKAEGPYLADIPPRVRVVDLDARRMRSGLLPLRSYLHRERPEVLLSAQDHGNLIAIAAARSLGLRIRLVAAVHTNVTRNWLRSPRMLDRAVPALSRWLYPRADAVVSVSHGAAADLSRAIGMPPGKIHVIPNPLHLETIGRKAAEPVEHPWFAEGSPPVIVAAGRLSREKNYPMLLRAFREVRERREARLLLLGEGGERGNLERLIVELKLGDDVRMPGFESNPYRYLSRAGLCALSSDHEGLPMILLEALACGCPVVATDCPSGPGEILDGGTYGRLVPVGDAGAMARAILSSLERPPEREHLRSRARDYSLERIVDRYLELLETV